MIVSDCMIGNTHVMIADDYVATDEAEIAKIKQNIAEIATRHTIATNCGGR